MTQMNDETRDEIVRLARKGWPTDQIARSVNHSATVDEQAVEAVIDAAIAVQDSEPVEFVSADPDDPWGSELFDVG